MGNELKQNCWVMAKDKHVLVLFREPQQGSLAGHTKPSRTPVEAIVRNISDNLKCVLLEIGPSASWYFVTDVDLLDTFEVPKSK